MSIENLRAADLDGMSDYGDEIAGLSRGLKKRANGKMKAARGMLKMGFGKARHSTAAARERTAELYGDLDEVMRSRPLVTLGVGLAIGAAAVLAISWLADRDR